MFDFFKAGKPTDVKGIRSAILQFVKEQLQKAEGGEGKNIKGLCLYINCSTEEKHLYESAVYADEDNRFKEDEVQRIADDYAIALPADWTMEIIFEETLPQEATKIPTVDAGLFVSTKSKRAVHKDSEAYIQVLNGEAEKPYYKLTSNIGKLNIGREKSVQTADGYFRKNDIAFPTDSTHESNRSISRQHAHIEYNPETGAFYLFADEGGVPPLNKVKVRSNDGNQFKLQTMEIGHKLQEGDQVIIGESAVIEFTYNPPTGEEG
ncbi:FHA domain-containing protein [Aridibaculum aurantiacum]|uniref:FHA domain-containing protein n=1 Tax=Aridibaculum aurantiacum TaxID=2810307 RepID=UPI001A97376E|nr:FHA domain-containing protein [Aridibaculum aurantiacum]